MWKKLVVWTGATVGLLLAALFLFVVVGMVFFAHSSAGGTLASGRAVAASADSCFIGMEMSANTAIIRTFRRTVEVTPTALKVDGQPVGVIPSAAKSVEVTLERGEIKCVADGKVIDLM